LVGVTSSKWRYRNMTILHWAMENGLETAKAMVNALDIRHDSERDEKYLYIDRDGIEYSPQQYAMRVWDADNKEKEALIACFKAAALKSRYFKRILPGKGEQPAGYHGLPASHARAWAVHEKFWLREDAASGELFPKPFLESLRPRESMPAIPSKGFTSWTSESSRG